MYAQNILKLFIYQLFWTKMKLLMYFEVLCLNSRGGKSREGKFQRVAAEAARRVAYSEANGRRCRRPTHSTTRVHYADVPTCLAAYPSLAQLMKMLFVNLAVWTNSLVRAHSSNNDYTTELLVELIIAAMIKRVD